LEFMAPYKKEHPLRYSFLYVVLKSEISQNFNEIIGEIGKWAEILESY